MTISIHVAADQMAQWWDSYVCRRSKKLRSIAPISRYYLALRVLESSGVLTRTASLEGDLFDLPNKAPEKLQNPILGQIRRLVDDYVADVSTAEMTRYMGAIMDGLERARAVKECGMTVNLVLNMIAHGDIEVIGWDAEGLLEVRATEQGAQKTGMARGELFLLAVG